MNDTPLLILDELEHLHSSIYSLGVVVAFLLGMLLAAVLHKRK